VRKLIQKNFEETSVASAIPSGSMTKKKMTATKTVTKTLKCIRRTNTYPKNPKKTFALQWLQSFYPEPGLTAVLMTVVNPLLIGRSLGRSTRKAVFCRRCSKRDDRGHEGS
jgi:hypothetical protein